MRRFKHSYIYVSLALSAFLTAGSAKAEIEEITVTANKREQSLQDIPLTVSVTSSDTIQKSSIVDLIDLQTAVPSLRVNTLQNSAQTNFTIRGFGNGANNPGIEPSVLVVVDGVPRSRSSSSLADLPNVERIEVLSGPQSTLFGKNASAGVISITTKAPEDEIGGVLETTVGNYGSQIVKGTITGPTGIENLNYRISASTNENDGYATNLGTDPGTADDTPLNNRDRKAVRAQLQWDIAEDLSARLIYDKDEIDEVCCVTGPLFTGSATDLNNAIVTGAFAPFIGALPLGVRGVLGDNANPWDYQVYMNFEPTNFAENEGFSLEIEKDLNGMVLTSITSDRQTVMNSNFDADFSSADLVEEQRLDYNFDTFTQELRLSSTTDNGIIWTAGVFYSDEDTINDRTVIFGSEMNLYGRLVLGGGDPSSTALADIAALENAVGETGNSDPNHPDHLTVDSFFTQGGGSTQELFDMNSETVSFFLNADIPLSNDVVATIGLNKTKDTKTVESNVVVDDAFSEIDLEFLAAHPAGGEEILDAQIAQFFPEFTNYPNDIGEGEDGIFESDDLTHTLRLTHEASENTKFFVSHSTGFKPVSVNLSVNAVDSTMRSAEEEFSTNVELGVKHVLDNGYLNLTLFRQKIKGFQSNTFNGTAFELTNAGNQMHQGFEFDYKGQFSENLLVGFQGMYIDAEYIEYLEGPCSHFTTDADGALPFEIIAFPSVACDPDPDNLAGYPEVDAGIRDRQGETPAGIHEWSANLNATYSFNLTDAISSFMRIEYVYESETAVVENVPGVNEVMDGPIGPIPVGNIPAVRSSKNVNMSMGFNHNPSGIELMLWGRNLTDHQSLLSAFPTTAAPGSFGGYPTPPKTYGITARAKF